MRARQRPLQAATFALAIMEMMKVDGEWAGPWSDLKRRLERTRHYMGGNVPMRRWPSDGRQLKDELSRYAPTLLIHGIDVEWNKRFGGGGDRGVIIRFCGHRGPEADTADGEDALLSADEPASSRGTDSADTADTLTFNTEEVEVSTGSATPHREAAPAESPSALSAVSADCVWCDFGDLPAHGMHGDEPCPRFPDSDPSSPASPPAGHHAPHDEDDDDRRAAG